MNINTTKDLLIIVSTGFLVSVYTLIAYGSIASPIHSEIVNRLNDFMNYAVQGLDGGDNLHPMYRGLIESNSTLAPLSAKFMLSIGFSRIFIESLITGAYLLIQNIGAPIFAYSILKDKKIAIILLISLLFISGNNEPIYSFITTGFITGNTAASLFLLEMGLVFLKRYLLLALALILHILLHPTTALMWLPIPIVMILFTSNITLKSEWKTLISKLNINYLIFLYPIFIGILLYTYEVIVQPFSKDTTKDFWEIATVSFYHTKFSDNEKFIYLFIYLCELVALYFLSTNKKFDISLRNLNSITFSLGIGIFITSIILVETNISQVFAMTLPFRFSVVMYVIIIISFVKIAADREDAFRFIAIIFISSLFFNRFLPGFYSYFKPMMISQFLILIYLYVTSQLSFRKVLTYSLIIFIAMILLYYSFPIDRLGDPKSQYIMYFYNKFELKSIGIHPKILSSAVLYFLNIIFILSVILILFLIRKYVDVFKFSLLILLFSVLNSIAIEQNRNLGLKNFLINLNLIGTIEKNSTSQLVQWIQSNVTVDKYILSEPSLQLRRMLPNHVSADLDLISILPYAPGYASYLYKELKETYCIDIKDLYVNNQFLNSKQFDNKTWTCSKNKAIESKSYDYVVEYVSRDKSSLPIVFENEQYRIYKITR